jgi:transcriptional regulator with XRE-family HTH domain
MSAKSRGVTNIVDVGAQLKRLREERQISMRTLAKASGLSANALSMIERGLTSPSVSTLTKLAGALQAPITAFFRREPDRQKIVYRPAESRIQIPLRYGLSENLGGDAFTERIEAMRLSFNPGCTSGPYALCHSGNEFIFVEKGQLDYQVDSQEFHLHTGDTLMFAAGLNHRWYNPGPDSAVVLVVISAFAEDERPEEYHLAVGEVESNDVRFPG